VERNFRKINKNLRLILKNKNEDRKNNLYTLKKLEKKLREKTYFHEICIKKVCSKMDQLQNGQRKKGPQQIGPRQSGHAIKLRTHVEIGRQVRFCCVLGQGT